MTIGRKGIYSLAIIIALAFILVGCIKKTDESPEEASNQAAPEDTSENLENKTGEETQKSQGLLEQTQSVDIENISQVILVTNFGDITFRLFPEAAPLTVANFVRLAEQNFYDGTKFHRVIKDFMIQGGDPNSKDDNHEDDGRGGPGYVFVDEINPTKLEGLSEDDIKNLEAQGYVYNYDLPISYNIVRGKIAMANSGPNTNGSQFFIITTEAANWLDGKHTVFGEVKEGMDIVDAIEAMKTVTGDYPEDDVIVNDVEVVREESEAAEDVDEEATSSATSSEETQGDDSDTSNPSDSARDR